jgi:hypothetical protein
MPGGDNEDTRARVAEQQRQQEAEEKAIKEEVHQIFQRRAAERDYTRRAWRSRG